MKSIDLSPLCRNSIGYARLGRQSDQTQVSSLSVLQHGTVLSRETKGAIIHTTDEPCQVH